MNTIHLRGDITSAKQARHLRRTLEMVEEQARKTLEMIGRVHLVVDTPEIAEAGVCANNALRMLRRLSLLAEARRIELEGAES